MYLRVKANFQIVSADTAHVLGNDDKIVYEFTGRRKEGFSYAVFRSDYGIQF